MNDAVQHYGWTTPQAPHTASYLLPAVIDALRSAGARRVLDLGCGNGALCAALASAGFDCVGADADAGGIAIASSAHPRLRFHRIGMHDDPAALLAETGRFDAVVSTEVIEHLYSPQLLPRFAAALLEPSGRLVLTTPYHGYLKNLALSLAGKWDHHHTALWHGGHIKFWSRATLTRLLHDEGFAVSGFRGVGRLPWLWKSMLIVARRPATAAGAERG